MSGTQYGDLTRVVLALQDVVKALYASQQILASGISINGALVLSTVAALPNPAPNGLQRYATNGRNSGEAAGAGTGCLVIGNGVSWRAVWSGSQVLA